MFHLYEGQDAVMEACFRMSERTMSHVKVEYICGCVTHVRTIREVSMRFSFIRFCAICSKNSNNAQPVLDTVENIRRNFSRLARVQIRLSGQPERNQRNTSDTIMGEVRVIAIREERGRNAHGEKERKKERKKKRKKKEKLGRGHNRYPNKNIIAINPSGHYMYHQI